MTAIEFTYWLSGFLSAQPTDQGLLSEEVERIKNALKTVKTESKNEYAYFGGVE